MALLDEDSFSMSLDKNAKESAGFVAKDSIQSPGYVTMTYVEDEGPEVDKKSHGKSNELSIDVQKISSFSLRRKKDREKITRKSSKTPPDSPKTKVPDVPSGQVRKPSKGGGANVKATSSRKQYSTLMENEMSSGAEDEDDDNFLLSKGHVAREKRSSSHPTSKTIPQEDDPSSKNVINPSFLFDSPILSNSLTSDITSGFPVRFTPPNEARFPESEFSTDNKTELQIGHMTDSDSHVIIPPPEVVSHVIISSPSGGFSTDNISTLPVLPPPPQSTSYIPPLPRPPSQPTVPEITEEPDWSVSEELYQKCTQQFYDLYPENGLLSGEKARDFFIQSRLPVDELSKIWKLSDIDHDGFLSLDEFVVAMKLVLMRRKKVDIPASLPDVLKPRPRSASSPVISKFFLPPPPPAKATPTEPPAETESSGPLIPSLVPPRPPPPTFHQRSKTEPTIAVSDAKPLQIEHVMIGDKPYAVVNVNNKTKRKEENVPSLIPVNDIKDSKSETSLLSHGSSETDSSLTTPTSALSLEPAVTRLISLELGEDTTGDEDDTLALVTGASSSHEVHPIPKPRKKKRSPQHKKDTDLQRSRTVMGRVTQAPPPKPTPYQGKSPLHTTVPAPISSDFQELDTVTPSPPPADDLAPIINTIKGPPHKQINEDLEKEAKGHGRSTSWDLTKMLREGTLDVHEDLPSAEPPKLPPRRNVGSPSSDDESRDKTLPSTTTTLQRSASTGSLSSIGQPTTATVHGSRSPSIESGSLVSAMELSGATPTDNLLARTSTMVIRRPAPLPPPITKPKPKKQPLYPPNFKKVNSPEPDPSMEEKPPLSLDVYQKKTKLELQKCVKELKEENDVYTKMNTELKNKLQELIEKRHRLEEKLKPYKTAHSSHAH